MGHGHFMKGHYSSEYTNACVDCFRRWRSEYNANKLIESIVTKCVDERLLPRENIDFKVLNFDEDDGFAKNIQFVIVGTTKKDKGFSAFGFNYLNPWGYPKKQASVA